MLKQNEGNGTCFSFGFQISVTYHIISYTSTIMLALSIHIVLVLQTVDAENSTISPCRYIKFTCLDVLSEFLGTVVHTNVKLKARLKTVQKVF